jgi:hypothetical protein
MPNDFRSNIVAALLTSLMLFGCGRSGDSASDQNPISDAGIQPGLHAFPTNAESAHWFEHTPEERRALFKNLLVSAGKDCDQVKKAIFQGGFEGTDMWQVKCTNPDTWIVTFAIDSKPTIQNEASKGRPTQ